MDRDWKPVSLPGLIAWMIFHCAFLVYAATNQTGFLFIDNVNLVVHEGGHLLFGWFGYSIGIWGGTLLQWLVPLLLAAFFFVQRETAGFTFCTFFFFENWLYTAGYMADARTMILPLVTVGDAEYTIHDWNFIFSQMGLLSHDTTIAAAVRLLGWLGMTAAAGSLVYRYAQKPRPTPAGSILSNSRFLKK